MSIKSAIQIIILIIIFIILGGVYYTYFEKGKIEVDKTNEKTERETTQKLIDSEIDQTNKKNEINENQDNFEDNNSNSGKTKKEKIVKNFVENNNSTDNVEKNEIPNFVKDVEYLTSDKNGNNYKILATTGKTNKKNKNIFDLKNVRGEITSEQRSTINIISDVAEYNSDALVSKFYNNVEISFEDNQIYSDNLKIDMDTSFIIAYGNVIAKNLNSIMKAGKIILNIETREIEINPENTNNIKINTQK